MAKKPLKLLIIISFIIFQNKNYFFCDLFRFLWGTKFPTPSDKNKGIFLGKFYDLQTFIFWILFINVKILHFILNGGLLIACLIATNNDFCRIFSKACTSIMLYSGRFLLNRHLLEHRVYSTLEVHVKYYAWKILYFVRDAWR